MKKLLILLLTVFLIAPVYAQSSAEAVLQISHKKKNKTKYVKQGRKIKVYTADEKISGRIDSIAPGIIYLQGRSVAIDEVEKVRFKLRGMQITGAVIGSAGLAVTTLGGIVIAQGAADNSFGGAILAGVGVVIVGIGLIPTTIGTTILLAGKSYKGKKWEFETAELVD